MDVAPFWLYYSSYIQEIFSGGGTHLNGLKSQFTPHTKQTFRPISSPLYLCDCLLWCSTSRPLWLSYSSWIVCSAELWLRHLEVPNTAIYCSSLKALRLCFTVGSVLFFKIKGGCPWGFTAQGISFVKAFLCNSASHLGLVVLSYLFLSYFIHFVLVHFPKRKMTSVL